MAGVEGLKRHWRHLVARYAAYPLVLVPGGEVPGVAKYGEAGRVGLWRSDLGEPQTYRNVKISRTGFAAPVADEVPEGECWIRGGEDLAPSVPSPQDWLLVLEKETL